MSLFFVLLSVLFAGFTVGAPGDVPLRVKCGGNGNPNGSSGNDAGYTTQEGHLFQYDRPNFKSFCDRNSNSVFCERCYTLQLERTFPSLTYPGEDLLYGCNRAGQSLSWRYENLPPGQYRLTIGFNEDKWQEFPIQNNGRIFQVYVQRSLVDIVDIFAEVGYRRAGLELEYCMEVTSDGVFLLDMENIIYGASPSFFFLTEVAAGTCKETIHENIPDKYWYSVTAPWNYLINVASSDYLSTGGARFSPDFGYWKPELVKDSQGRDLPGWSANRGWALCSVSATCNGTNFLTLGGCNCGRADSSTQDQYLQLHKRVGSVVEYTLPVNQPGPYWVFFTTYSQDFAVDLFNFTAEKGEGANHELLMPHIHPGQLAGGVSGSGGSVVDYAVVVGALVNVRMPNLNLRWEIVDNQGLGSGPNNKVVISTIMVQKAISLTAPPPNLPLNGMPIALSKKASTSTCVAATVCEAGQCGSWSDGCGGTLSCGGCPAGQRCSTDGPWDFFGQGRCESDHKPRACLAGECGANIDDGGGRLMHCGQCPGQELTPENLCVRNRCVSLPQKSNIQANGVVDATGPVVMRLKCGRNGNFCSPGSTTNGPCQEGYTDSSGNFWEADRPYLTSPHSGGTSGSEERCYGPDTTMRFSEDDIDLYRCNRGNSLITYHFPVNKVPDGNYMIRILQSDDKWDEFPQSNNGRAITLKIENEVRDIMLPWGKLGFTRAAVDFKYCASVSGGLDLELSKTGTWGQSPIISGIEIVSDPDAKCKHSIYERLDTWYKGPLMDPFALQTTKWVYAINCGDGHFLSSDRITFQLDGHYWFDQIPDGAGGLKIGWHGNDDYNFENRPWENVRVLDIPLFTTRRRTSGAGGMSAAPAYKIPLLDGWYLVYLIMGDRPYGNEDFTVYFEPGEPGSHVVPGVRPEVMAGGEYKAIVLARFIHVSGNFLNIDTSVENHGDGLGANFVAIMIAPFDGNAALPDIGMPIYQSASVVPPNDAVPNPCVALGNCHLGTSWCTHVESDPSVCAAYTDLAGFAGPGTTSNGVQSTTAAPTTTAAASSTSSSSAAVSTTPIGSTTSAASSTTMTAASTLSSSAAPGTSTPAATPTTGPPTTTRGTEGPTTSTTIGGFGGTSTTFSAAPTTSSLPCPSAVLQDNPSNGRPCILCCFPIGALRRIRFRIRLDTDYDFFDCLMWRGVLATKLLATVDEISICNLIRGSTEIEVEADSALTGRVDQMMQEIRNEQDPGLGAPVLSAVALNGDSVVPGQQAEPFPYWVVGVAVGGAILIAVVIIVVVLVVRRRKGYYSSGGRHPYTKMQTF